MSIHRGAPQWATYVADELAEEVMRGYPQGQGTVRRGGDAGSPRGEDQGQRSRPEALGQSARRGGEVDERIGHFEVRADQREGVLPPFQGQQCRMSLAMSGDSSEAIEGIRRIGEDDPGANRQDQLVPKRFRQVALESELPEGDIAESG